MGEGIWTAPWSVAKEDELVRKDRGKDSREEDLGVCSHGVWGMSSLVERGMTVECSTESNQMWPNRCPLDPAPGDGPQAASRRKRRVSNVLRTKGRPRSTGTGQRWTWGRVPVVFSDARVLLTGR